MKSRLSLSVMRGRGGRSRSRGGRFRGRGVNMPMRGMPNRGRGSNLSRQQSALSLGMGGPGNMDDGRNMSLLQGRGRGNCFKKYFLSLEICFDHKCNVLQFFVIS